LQRIFLITLIKKNLLWVVLFFEIVAFTLIVIGFLPRSIVPYFVAVLALYLIFTPLEDGVLFFVSSIPLFLAIPITKSFDNFNSWRIFSFILLFKWGIRYGISNIFNNIFSKKIWRSKIIISLLLLLIFASLSIIVAPDKIVAIKKIIYFINLSLIGIIIYDFVKNNNNFATRLVKAIAIPTIIITAVGFLQLASTYLLDIFQFIGLWGERIQCNQFGQQWCQIAVNDGNTWFAYYGDQLSLRVFSLFPDSHSFPVFLLFGLPSIFALSFHKIAKRSSSYREMIKIRGRLYILLIPLIFLIMLLSGTRGIWAASVGVVLFVIFTAIFMWKKSIGMKYRALFNYIASYIVFFFILLSVAFPIFVSPQFLLSKGDSGLFGNRLRSIIDFGETSNAQRIYIWKSSLNSIKKHPILGVGIGNFPVVLSQDIQLAKAGSSAHNIYLHIASEMGVFALVISLWLLFILIKKIYLNYIHAKDSLLLVYFSSLLLFIPWVFLYLLTDVVLFDERAFLIFVVMGTLVFGVSAKSINKV